MKPPPLALPTMAPAEVQARPAQPVPERMPAAVRPTRGRAPGRAAVRLEAAQPARPKSEPEPLRSRAARTAHPTRVMRPVTNRLENPENPMCPRQGWPAPAHRPSRGTEARRSSEPQG
jgi:hypothetical protein